jgi:hypothetical protein
MRLIIEQKYPIPHKLSFNGTLTLLRHFRVASFLGLAKVEEQCPKLGL